MKKLQSFAIHHNLIGGTIPEGWKGFEGLSFMYLSDNNLSGTVPDGLANSQSLALLDISENDITGSIPEGLCRFADDKTSFIFVDSDEVTCPVGCWCIEGNKVEAASYVYVAYMGITNVDEHDLPMCRRPVAAGGGGRQASSSTWFFQKKKVRPPLLGSCPSWSSFHLYTTTC